MSNNWHRSLEASEDQGLSMVKTQALRKGAAKKWWEPLPDGPRFLVNWNAWPLPSWVSSQSVAGIWCQRVPAEDNVAFLRPDCIRLEKDIWASRARGYQGLRLSTLPVGGSLQYFLEVCRELGMVPIVQVENKDDLKRALQTDADIVESRTEAVFRMLQDFDWDIVSGHCYSVQQVQDAVEKGGVWFSLTDDLWLQLIQPGSST